MALKIVQWTTGNVGQCSTRAILANPDLELVGCYAWSPDKVGCDVGELCGSEPIGVTATNDVDALLRLEPDCVVYNPQWQDPDELIRILEAGVNVVSTASFITGGNLGADRIRLEQACERGGSTLFGTGCNPGLAQMLSLVTASFCDRIDRVSITESADTTLYDSPSTEIPVGFGRALEDPDLRSDTEAGTVVFAEAVAMLADGLGIELDDIVCEAEYARTTEDVVMDSWTIAAGCVAGICVSWKGMVGDRNIINITMRWKKGYTLEPDWVVDDVYVIEIEGRPTVTNRIQILPPPDFEAKTFTDFIVLGMIMTAMPAVNAIARVVAARPGIVTYDDIPFPTPRSLVPA